MFPVSWSRRTQRKNSEPTGNAQLILEYRDIEKMIILKGKFAFIQFKNDQDAEMAKKNLQGKELQGLKLNIEWSKKSGRFDENRNMTSKKSKYEEFCLLNIYI